MQCRKNKRRERQWLSKNRIFVKERDEMYELWFKESEVLPARSAVQVAKLPKDVKVEIEVIAVK